jgi:short-subunit dehydrogenase
MESEQAGKNPVKAWALVTGASAGIGEEFCNQLAAMGYSLVLVARRGERLQQLAERLDQRHGASCRCFPMDLSAPEASRELVGSLTSEGIKIEFLVNNAGYGVPGLYTVPDWKAHADSLQLMLTSVCELTWRLLPGMHARNKGYIVNVASLAGLVPGSAAHTLYGATKSFLIRFSESLACENLDTGVNVSALCPGFTYSEFHDVTGSRELVSQMPGYMWMTAEEVVSYGLESVLGDKPRVLAIPGRVNRFIAQLMRLMPRRLAMWLTQRESRRWRAQASKDN